MLHVKKLKPLSTMRVKQRKLRTIRFLLITKAEQDQIVKTAKEAIALEKKQALSEIRAHVINLSLVAASKIVEQKLGSEEDKKLAGDIVDAVLKQ